MQGAEGQRSRNPKKDETEYKHKVLLESGKVKRKACCIITLLLACNKEKPTEKLPGTPPFPTPSTDPLKEPAVPAATTAKSRRALLRLPPPPFCYISSLHLLCHMRVCVCVSVSTCLDCWMQTGAKAATATHCLSGPSPSVAPRGNLSVIPS